MIGETVFSNARVVTRQECFAGSVRIGEGAVAEIAPGRRRPPGSLDLEGDYLLPGLVELHTDMLEKHAVPRPRVQWPTVAAVMAHDAQLAAAGITTVLDGLAVGYVVDTLERPRDPRPFADAIRHRADRRAPPRGALLPHALRGEHRARAGGLRALRRGSPGPARLSHGPHARAASVRPDRKVPRVQPGEVRARPTPSWTP